MYGVWLHLHTKYKWVSIKRWMLKSKSQLEKIACAFRKISFSFSLSWLLLLYIDCNMYCYCYDSVWWFKVFKRGTFIFAIKHRRDRVALLEIGFLSSWVWGLHLLWLGRSAMLCSWSLSFRCTFYSFLFSAACT